VSRHTWTATEDPGCFAGFLLEREDGQGEIWLDLSVARWRRRVESQDGATLEDMERSVIQVIRDASNDRKRILDVTERAIDDLNAHARPDDARALAHERDAAQRALDAG
jgi:hypothetical protein